MRAGFAAGRITPAIIAAMRADVRQTMCLHVFIDRQQQRFVQTTFEQRKRPHVTGRFHLRGFTDELPGARENFSLGAFVPRKIDIYIRGQCFRAGNVVVYLKTRRRFVHRFCRLTQIRRRRPTLRLNSSCRQPLRLPIKIKRQRCACRTFQSQSARHA